jgi:fructokinase
MAAEPILGAAMSAAGKPLICLGEGLVDLICPEPVSDPAEAARFEVHPGGALANVAVAARRAGAPAALASACGDDHRGRFLRRRLAAAGIDLRFYGELEDVPTPFAFAYLDPDLEPSFEIHGAGIDDSIASLAGREEEIAGAGAGVVFGSNTLVDERSRAVTAAVVAAAGERGVPVLFDPNLRPGRWRAVDDCRERCLAFVTDATVLRCNLAEARLLAGADDLDAAAAATALLELGPRLAVVTAGPDLAVARGACAAEARPPRVDVRSPLGAGDAFMGTFAAGLYAAGFDLAGAEAALAAAVAAGARTCTHLEAFPS